MTHGSVFTGIGGFDLAAQWMGWDNVFQCEINPFCQKVLKYYWPKAKLFKDIKTANLTPYANRIDVLTGGFPCQPYSVAGQRKGTEDERHLWPYMLGAIRKIRPTWALGENVGGIVSWNAGLVFEQVQADLEAEGYEVQPFILPACGVGAPHRRDRVWFVAYSDSFQRCKRGMQAKRPIKAERHTCSCHARIDQPTGWKNFPTQPPVCGRNDGLPPPLAGITVSKHRNESIKGYGNAIVPQVALQIFKAIQEYENRINRR